jgi:membrane fusion protein, multidrug efflux system
MSVARNILRIGAVGSALFAGALQGCRKEQPGVSKPKVPVSVAQVALSSAPYNLEATGAVEPIQTVAIESQVSGILDAVRFTEGQDVSEGQVLFEIDPRPFRAALNQAKATLVKDSAQAENAKREAARYEALVQKEYVTKSQAEQAAAQAASLAASVVADRASVDRAELDLANSVIRSPIRGRTGSLLVHQGNLVRANSGSPLVVVNRIRPVLVRFSVPADALDEIRRNNTTRPLAVTAIPSGMSVAVPAAMTGSSDTARKRAAPIAGGGQLRGPLSFVNNAVDEQTGTVMLKAKFENADGRLWPGQYVTVRLEVFVRRDALMIPAEAVLTGQKGQYVYVVAKDGTAERRPVTIGRQVDSMYVVESGLKVGEDVIVDGQARLTPGAKVVVKGAQDKPAGASQSLEKPSDSARKL